MNKNLFYIFIFLLFAISIATPATAQTTIHQLKTIIIDAGHGFPDGGAQGSYSYESDVALSVAKKLFQKLQDSLPQCKILMTRTTADLPNGMTNPHDANRWRAEFANENHGDLFVSIHCNDAAPVYHSEVVGHRTEVYHTGRGSHRKRHTRRVPVYHYWTTPSQVQGTETYVWAVNKNDSKQQFIQHNQDSTELYGENQDSTQTDMTPEEKIMAAIRTRKYFSHSLLLANLIQNEYINQGRTNRGVLQRNEKGIWVLQATAMPSVLTEIGFISNPDEENYLNSASGQDQIASNIFQAIVTYKNLVESGKVH
jgi:N-acetylmuramoyl-L-alanine amidase